MLPAHGFFLLYRELRRRRSSYENHPLSGWFRKGFCRSGGSLVQRELSPQATEGLFLSCEFCNPSASRCSAPPFTQGRRKVVVVAFATAVQICKCQTFSEGFQPCQYHCPYRAVQATGFAGGYDLCERGVFTELFLYSLYTFSNQSSRSGMGRTGEKAYFISPPE